jgi:hypothetical protein
MRPFDSKGGRLHALLVILACGVASLSTAALAKGDGIQLWLVGTVADVRQNEDRITFQLTGSVELVQYRRNQRSLIRVQSPRPVPVSTRQADFFFLMEDEWGAGPGAPGKLVAVLRSAASSGEAVRLEAGKATMRFGGPDDPIAIDASEVYRVYRAKRANSPHN